MLILERTDYRPDGIFGKLWDETAPDARNFCGVTLEHSFPGDKPIVPAGVYKCKRYYSPHFMREVWLLQDVPGHDHVEIHYGNYNHDSDGCILLGRRILDLPAEWMITSSQNTFNAFMDRTRGLDEITLTIKDKE